MVGQQALVVRLALAAIVSLDLFSLEDVALQVVFAHSQLLNEVILNLVFALHFKDTEVAIVKDLSFWHVLSLLLQSVDNGYEGHRWHHYCLGRVSLLHPFLLSHFELLIFQVFEELLVGWDCNANFSVIYHWL